jgi:hypothetical protein
MMKRHVLILTVLSLAAIPMAAMALQSQPLEINIRNAELHRQGATDNLQRDFAALVSRVQGPAWAGYAVPMVEGNRSLCCGCGDGNWRGVCRLESSNGGYQTSDDEVQYSGTLLVFFRIDGGRAHKIRVFSEDCEIDAGGKDVYWWSEVEPTQSLALLESQVRDRQSMKMAESAVMAIAHHGHRQADGLLETFADDDQPEDIAENAIFWMGAARSRSGFESLKRVSQSVRDTDLREQITFALYISNADGATAELVGMARNDRNSDVRGQALFWLGQKAGKQAAATIKDAIEDDPELEIKKKAVFALSQLPPDEGVPLLIDVAKTHRNSAIRKKAMFWLGQSGDPRALDMFEEILLKK